MAEAIWLHPVVGIVERVDGLCTECGLPALAAAPVYLMGDQLEPRPVGTITACTDCRHVQRDA